MYAFVQGRWQPDHTLFMLYTEIIPDKLFKSGLNPFPDKMPDFSKKCCYSLIHVFLQVWPCNTNTVFIWIEKICHHILALKCTDKLHTNEIIQLRILRARKSMLWIKRQISRARELAVHRLLVYFMLGSAQDGST